MASKLLSMRRFSRLVKSRCPSVPYPSSSVQRSCALRPEACINLLVSSNTDVFPSSASSRNFCSRPFNIDESQGPATIDYRSLLQEEDFQSLADLTIHDLQEKLEEYGDDIQIDGFDIDYGSDVLTVKLGALGTYVLNKQTPNRQIWLSSPVSGPSRYDWDKDVQTWVYRRTGAKLYEVLESELKQLCDEPISLS
ncbi:putative Frataxin mitochondrial precursor [Tripterygium wilfordii]|uniref:ferroxidase n=1 Tax=Tripterygium wilfordii TaxID=458696 RepID=A0A7J7DI44_TRIWF|nr:frataxin, mitochondrial-like isoform X1 [Tripterygium wilfordii]KAF5746021.1 putative Frataxin mitochondrial precursor [Tripterygium wilfordii]